MPTEDDYLEEKCIHDQRTIRINCPKLTLAEWEMLCICLQATILSDDIAPLLWLEVADSDQEEFGLDLMEFSGRLKKYSILQNLAILHAVDNFGNLYHLKLEFAEHLRQAGANIKDA